MTVSYLHEQTETCIQQIKFFKLAEMISSYPKKNTVTRHGILVFCIGVVFQMEWPIKYHQKDHFFNHVIK